MAMKLVKVGFASFLLVNLFIFCLTQVSAQNDAVKAWLTSNAIDLKTVEAGSGFADMQPLKKVVGSAPGQ